jgi:hypothetical protein
MKLVTGDLIRIQDDSGVSGTGKVAEYCQFSDGTVVVQWVGVSNSKIHSTCVYHSLADAQAIHGHGTHTRFVPHA